MRRFCPAATVIALSLTALTVPDGAGAAVDAEAAAGTGTAPEAGTEYVPGEAVVRFAATSEVRQRRGALGAIRARASAPIGAPRTRVVALAGEGASVPHAVAKLAGRDAVLWAEPNYIFRPTALPADPLFADGYLWGLYNDRQTVKQLIPGSGYQDRAGTPGADIGAIEAWQTNTGSDEVLVGIADTGIAVHPDLDANLRPDLARDFRFEFGDQDDPEADASGHGTHVAGTVGAVGDNGVGLAGVNWEVGLVGLRVLDPHGGTSADVAAAFTHAGASGIDVVNASLGGPGASTAVADAIREAPGTLFVVAAGNAAGDHDSSGAEGAFPCDIEAENLICVAATGNDGELSFFSDYGVESVDLAGPGNGIASTYPRYFSAHQIPDTGDGALEPDGDSLVSPVFDLGGDRGCALLGHVALDLAPGEEVALEVRRGAGSWRLVDRFTESANLEHGLQADGEASVSIRFRLIPNGADEPDLNGVQTSDLVVYCLDTAPGAGGYALSSGTSMAAPHVAGAAGLLLAVQPDLSVDELREALLSTVTPESTLAGKTVTGGSLDLAAAMAAIQPPLDPETDGDSDEGETEDTAEDGDSGDSEGDRDTGAEADDEGTADEDGTGEGHSAESDSAESELLAERLRASVWAGRQNLRRRGGLVFRAVGNRDTTLRARAVIRWRGDRVWLGSHFSRPIRLRPMSKWTIEAGRPAQLRMPVRPAHIRRVVRLRRLGARPVAVLWVLVSAPGQTAPPLERLVLRVG